MTEPLRPPPSSTCPTACREEDSQHSTALSSGGAAAEALRLHANSSHSLNGSQKGWQHGALLK